MKPEAQFLKNNNTVETINPEEVKINNSDMFTPEEVTTEKNLEEKTLLTVEEIKKLVKTENIIKLTPEKRIIVLDKVKALMLVLVALGAYVAYKDLDAMEAASNLPGQASKEAMIGFAGTATAVLSLVGLGIRNVYNKFKLEEERQNPKTETI